MELASHHFDGSPVLVWRFPGPKVVVSSAPVGGGLGLRRWVLNAQVGAGYTGADVVADVRARAIAAGLDGDGVGMLTAADVTDVQHAADGGVDVWATVGIAVPTWAAAPDDARSPTPVPPGTINVVASVPVPLSEAALVNAVATVAEAKAQALLELGVEGTGTATDAVCISCPVGEGERYGGPRSRWGARLARAVHATVLAGAPRSIVRDP